MINVLSLFDGMSCGQIALKELDTPVKKYQYRMVYNTMSKTWYQSTEVIDAFVQNMYPQLYALEISTNVIVKDFSEKKKVKVDIETIKAKPAVGDTPAVSQEIKEDVEIVAPVEISFVTRPLNFGTFEFKAFDKFILRAILHQAKDVIYMTNTAIDDTNFKLEKGMVLKVADTDLITRIKPADTDLSKLEDHSNYKDVNIGRFIKKHRQMIVMFTAVVSENSRIYSIDAEIEGAYPKLQ